MDAIRKFGKIQEIILPETQENQTNYDLAGPAPFTCGGIMHLL
jgi:hypothetical protein